MKLKSLLLSLLTLATLSTTNAQNTIGNVLTPGNAQRYYDEFKGYFTDGTCSELALPYSAMTDDELREVMWNTPKELIDIALKVKNNTWAPREKEFRVAEYRPHNNVYTWSIYLNTYQYSALQHPTGIRADAGDTLLIFIDNVKQGTFLKLNEIAKNEAFADWGVMNSEKTLVKGLNLVTVAQSDAILFISYAVTTDTTANSPRIDDYPNARIHIQGGDVNCYFDKSRHTDEDWRDMIANHFKHYSVQVKGERVLFHMELNNIKKICPNTISDAIGWWDRCLAWQHELMGVDKYHDRFNSLLMARDGYEGMYMYATSNYTYYEHNTLSSILPWATVYANPGQMWGPAHEIGHINQGAINIVSCTEASNNLFSNVQLFNVGKTTTRGLGVANCANDFNNKVPFPLRSDAIGKSRMYYQLFLYFHATGKDKTFYPRVFEALRQDPLDKGPNRYTNGVDDQLKFAEKCCEVAQMDLSEFFEAWGFFEPMQEANVDDYGTYIVSLTKEDAEASRTRMQKYPKKGGHLMFIEDRIKPSKRTDGVDGYRIDFNEEYAVGKMGDTGQWEEYIDEDIKAEGYFYTNSNGTIDIKKADNAKGALGFKVYNAETGRLLAFSNTYSIKIPTYAKYYDIKVVAAQADGTDYDIPSAAMSDNEEWQKTALEAQLTSINDILQRTTTDGSQIGRYYKDAVKDLSDIYQKAKAAVKNNDTSEHSYREWSSMLEEELERLKNNPSARAYFEELDVFNIINVKYRGYYMCNTNYGIEAVYNLKTLEDKAQKSWLVERTEEDGVFYIKNKNGKYINNIEFNGAYCGGTSTADAVMFKAHYLNNGNIYFTVKGSDKFLSVNSEYKIVCTEAMSDYSLWNVVVEEKNSTAIKEIEAEDEENNVVYDLLGRKVTEPGKGIYIKNGEKTIIR